MTIEPTSHSPTVLIIDDSEDMRQLVRHYIMVEWRGAKIEDWDPVYAANPAAIFRGANTTQCYSMICWAPKRG